MDWQGKNIFKYGSSIYYLTTMLSSQRAFLFLLAEPTFK
jgi:hypothetical protein